MSERPVKANVREIKGTLCRYFSFASENMKVLKYTKNKIEELNENDWTLPIKSVSVPSIEEESFMAMGVRRLCLKQNEIVMSRDYYTSSDNDSDSDDQMVSPETKKKYAFCEFLSKNIEKSTNFFSSDKLKNHFGFGVEYDSLDIDKKIDEVSKKTSTSLFKDDNAVLYHVIGWYPLTKFRENIIELRDKYPSLIAEYRSKVANPNANSKRIEFLKNEIDKSKHVLETYNKNSKQYFSETVLTRDELEKKGHTEESIKNYYSGVIIRAEEFLYNILYPINVQLNSTMPIEYELYSKIFYKDGDTAEILKCERKPTNKLLKSALRKEAGLIKKTVSFACGKRKQNANVELTPLTQQNAGAPKQYVLYNRRVYLLRREGRAHYIFIKKQKTFLSEIRGKYERV